MLRVAILISGHGSNMENLIRYFDGHDRIKITLVISDNEDARGLVVAKEAGILTQFAASGHEGRIIQLLQDNHVDIVCLAGYMRILSKDFCDMFKGRILNIHPSLLPKYPGLHTHKRVLAEGDRYHGATVHYVDENLDQGQIIMSGSIVVHSDDDETSLRHRVRRMEHQIYPQALLNAARRYSNARNSSV